MERLLVTGIDTIAGSNLALALSDRCEVLGLFGQCALEAPAVRTDCWHADDQPAIKAYVRQWQPHWIVHCGPLAASSWDPAFRVGSAEREPLVVAQLAELADEWGCRLTVISSDVVFSGPRMFHEESSPAASPAPRALQVRNMERALEKREALVVRTHAYGWSADAERAGFAELAFDALARGAPLAPLFSDGRRHATPILATDLAELLWRAYESRLHGLYHLAGTERTSPHRFVVELAGALGAGMPAGMTDAGANSSWLEETSLSSKRARRMLAAATPMLRDGLNRFVEQAQNGWRERWRRVGPVSGPRAVAA